ncbi:MULTISPECIES: YbaN family protein [Vibrio]|uniref:Inner membrane protein n=2 Tax=Vibrio TaxID=662 RepID=A0A7X4LKF0_9VIBR|nr:MULTISPECIES: YbaN family protein [Vibrio]MBF8999878.1 YbaN family protein [Vibrio nitrifigilis]MZI93461.1 DUF454 family protein [Vibrio eleionomae]
MSLIRKSLTRFACLLLGWIALLLGIVGIVLPVLPTTPFILLASFCFIRSSPRYHSWLHQHPWFGPILTNWEKNRSVSKITKRRGLVVIVLSFCFSIYIVRYLWLKVLLFVVFVVLISWFIKLPVNELVDNRRENH